MYKLLLLVRQLETQLLLAIAAFLLLSWPVINADQLNPAGLYYYLFGVWTLIPSLLGLFAWLIGGRDKPDKQ